MKNKDGSNTCPPETGPQTRVTSGHRFLWEGKSWTLHFIKSVESSRISGFICYIFMTGKAIVNEWISHRPYGSHCYFHQRYSPPRPFARLFLFIVCYRLLTGSLLWFLDSNDPNTGLLFLSILKAPWSITRLTKMYIFNVSIQHLVALDVTVTLQQTIKFTARTSKQLTLNLWGGAIQKSIT